VLDYPVEHDETIFDVCDFDGRICLSGRLNSGKSHEIDLSSLNAGKYQLYLIDEGDILRKIISLN